MTKERDGRMNKTMKTILASAMVAALLPVSASAQDYDRYGRERYPSKIDTVVQFERQGSVDLSLLAGHIRVTTWDRPQVKVVASSDQGRLRFSASETRVSLEAERSSDETRYDITVPRGTKIAAEAVSGDISVSGTGGEVEAQSVSGSVEISDAAKEVTAESVSGAVGVSNVTGNLSAQSTSGAVTIHNATGDVETETVSGRILLDGIHSGSVRTETVSGAVTYTGSIDAGGRYSFVTHSGTLRLNLPANVGAVFSVETYSGDIDSDFPVTMQPGQGRNSHDRFEFTIGNGKARVSAENFSGKIIINRVGDANDRRND
jgi:DUF4097 and DUF4098 domain-containing protein YvlB